MPLHHFRHHRQLVLLALLVALALGGAGPAVPSGHAAADDQQIYLPLVVKVDLVQRLTPAAVKGAGVTEFSLTRDGQRLVYMASDLAGAGSPYSLYSLPTAGGTPVELPRISQPGGTVRDYMLSPDGVWVIYVADQDSAEAELFSVPADGSAAPVRLNIPVPAGTALSFYDISPDSTRVVYGFGTFQSLADPLIYEIHSVAIGGGQSTAITLPAGTKLLKDITFTPDSRWIFFNAYGSSYTKWIGAYMALIQGGASQPRPATGKITGDGQRTVYLRTIDGQPQLISRPFPEGAEVRLTPPLVEGGRIYDYRLSGDGGYVLYTADQEERYLDELYVVPIAGGAVRKLNAPIGAQQFPEAGGSRYRGVDFFLVSPDGTRVLYRASSEYHWVRLFDLYSVPLAGGEAVKLAAYSEEYKGVMYLYSTADSQRVFYIHNGQKHYFVVPIDGGTATPVQLAPRDSAIKGFPIDGPGFAYRPFDRISPDDKWFIDVVGTTVKVSGGDSYDALYFYAAPLAGGAPVQLNSGRPLAAATNLANRYAFTPDGSRLIFMGEENLSSGRALFSIVLPGR